MSLHDQNTSLENLGSPAEGEILSTSLFRPEPESDGFSRRILLKGIAAGSALAVTTPVGSALAASEVAHYRLQESCENTGFKPILSNTTWYPLAMMA